MEKEIYKMLKEKEDMNMIVREQETNKFLNTIKFNLLALKTKKKVIAVGGISSSNINKLRNTNSFGFAAISYFKKHDNINSLIYKK